MCKCGQPNAPSKHYCAVCHAAYMRNWRLTHPLNPVQRVKQIARAYAREYQKRGRLTPQPCEGCQSTEVERHHEDYSKPLQIRWLCRKCHLALHARENRISDALR